MKSVWMSVYDAVGTMGEMRLIMHMSDRAHCSWSESVEEGYTVDEILSMAADGFEVLE